MNGGRKFCTVNMVIDTTVWVHLFRRDERAREFLLNLNEDLIVCRTSVMELIYGRSSKSDIVKMQKQFKSLNIVIKEIDERISSTAGEIFEQYFPTRGIGLLDSFVAATAIINREKLATHNTKHFKFISDLEIIKPY